MASEPERYVVDSNVFFDLFRNETRVVNWFSSVRPSQINVSAIVHLEVLQSRMRPQAIEQYEYIAKDFKTLIPDGNVFAQARRVLREWDHDKGKPDIPDILIGTTARILGCPIVTSNKKDFENIDGLEIIVPGE